MSKTWPILVCFCLFCSTMLRQYHKSIIGLNNFKYAVTYKNYYLYKAVPSVGLFVTRCGLALIRVKPRGRGAPWSRPRGFTLSSPGDLSPRSSSLRYTTTRTLNIKDFSWSKSTNYVPLKSWHVFVVLLLHQTDFFIFIKHFFVTYLMSASFTALSDISLIVCIFKV